MSLAVNRHFKLQLTARQTESYDWMHLLVRKRVAIEQQDPVQLAATRRRATLLKTCGALGQVRYDSI